jgi:hypothetical protein
MSPTKQLPIALFLIAALSPGGCATDRAGHAVLAPSLDVGSGPPEDLKVSDGKVYVSNSGDGSVLKLDLTAGGVATTFVPPAGDAYRSAWGLQVDERRHWLLSVQNQPWDFNPMHALAGRVTAYDLTSGAKVKSWDLPAQMVGNSIDVDAAGTIYVGDLGPTPRIVAINPVNDEVSTWASSDQWVAGGFGIGGLVYAGSGLYAAHDNALWYIAIQGDGRAATPQKVQIAGNPIIFADGMAWNDGTILYVENDLLVAGAHGTAYEVRLDGPTTATRTAVQGDLRDPSGVATATVAGRRYLLVTESQLGYAVGVDKGQPSMPYQLKLFAR